MLLKFATNTQKQNTGFDFCTVNVFCKRNENKNLKNIRKASHRRCILILQHTRDKHILFVLFHTSNGVFSVGQVGQLPAFAQEKSVPIKCDRRLHQQLMNPQQGSMFFGGQRKVNLPRAEC